MAKKDPTDLTVEEKLKTLFLLQTTLSQIDEKRAFRDPADPQRCLFWEVIPCKPLTHQEENADPFNRYRQRKSPI